MTAPDEQTVPAAGEPAVPAQPAKVSVEGHRDQIRAALEAAVANTELKFHAYPDISGAAVSGRDIEAYVLATTSGYQVDIFGGDDSNPQRIVRTKVLAEAVEIAVLAVLDNQALRRRWLDANGIAEPSETLMEYRATRTVSPVARKINRKHGIT